MSGHESAHTPVQQAEQHKIFNMRNGAAVVAVAAAIGSFKAIESGSSTSRADTAPVPTQVNNENSAEANCNNLTLDNNLNNTDVYNSDAFFPNTTVTNQNDAKRYILDLFSSNGPLAGHASPNALAAILATVVNPATEKGFVKTHWDYLAEYNSALSRYTGANATENASADCKKALKIIVEDVSFNTDWANPGETISQFAAVRADGKIVDAALNTGTVKQKFSGIELKLLETSKNQNGYLSVLISTNTPGVENGTMYIKGLTQAQTGAANVQTSHKPQTTRPFNKPQPHGSANGLSGNIVTRSANNNQNQNVQVSGGGNVTQGHHPENQSGPNTGTKIGPHNNGKSPVSRGHAPTPSGGSGGGNIGSGPGPEGTSPGGPSAPSQPSQPEQPQQPSQPSQPPEQPPQQPPQPPQPPQQPPQQPPSQPPVKGPDPGQPGA